MSVLSSVVKPVEDYFKSLFKPPRIDSKKLIRSHGAAELAELLPYRFYDEDNDLYVMDEGYGFTINILPIIGVSPQRYDMLSSVLSRTVPDDATVQIMHYSSPKIGYKLQKWKDDRDNQDPFLSKLADKRIEFLSKHVSEPIGSSRNFMLRDHSVYLSVSKKGLGEVEVMRELVDYRINLLATLKNVCGMANLVKPGELISFMGDCLNPSTSVRHNDRSYSMDREIKEQIVDTDTSFEVYRDFVNTSVIRNSDSLRGESPIKDNGQDDALQIRCFEISRIPKHIEFGMMSNGIGDFFMTDIGHNLPVIQVLNVYYPPHEKMKEYIEGKTVRARQVAEGLTGKFNVETRDRAQDFERAQKSINDNHRVTRMTFHGAVIGSREECASALRSARTVYQSLQLEVKFSRRYHFLTYLGLMPMMGAFGISADYIKFKRRKTIVSDSVPALAPLFGEHVGTAHRCMLFVGRRGQIMNWSPFVSGGEGNHNAIVSGSPGAGKSVLISDMMMSHVAMNGHVCVIDNGYSFQNFALIAGGNHYTFKSDGEFCLNPFDMVDESRSKKDKEYLNDRLELCVQLFGQMINGSKLLSQEESGIIQDCVSQVWESHGRRGGANQVAEILAKYDSDSSTANTPRMVNAMRPYTGEGQYAMMFNGKNTLDMSNKITVFETKPLENKPGLRDIVVTALFGLIDMKVTSDRSRRDLVVLDECWIHFKSLALSKVIEGWGRRLRKENGGLIIGTQTMEELDSNESTRVILGTSQWKIIMRASRSSVEAMDRLKIIPDAYAKKCLNDLTTVPGQYSEAMIMCNSWYAMARLPLDPFSAALYTTTADQVVEINNLQEMGHSLEEAIFLVSCNQEKKDKAKRRLGEILDQLEEDELVQQMFGEHFCASSQLKILQAKNDKDVSIIVSLHIKNKNLNEKIVAFEEKLEVEGA